MRFPRQEEREDKKMLEGWLEIEFKNSRSWEEFCLNANVKYGVRISKLSKWWLAYCCIDYGDWTRVVLFLMTAFSPLVLAIIIKIAFGIGPSRVALVLAIFGFMALFSYLFVKWISFGEFLDRLEGVIPYC